jgi:hypothetical protein
MKYQKEGDTYCSIWNRNVIGIDLRDTIMRVTHIIENRDTSAKMRKVLGSYQRGKNTNPI